LKSILFSSHPSFFAHFVHIASAVFYIPYFSVAFISLFFFLFLSLLKIIVSLLSRTPYFKTTFSPFIKMSNAMKKFKMLHTLTATTTAKTSGNTAPSALNSQPYHTITTNLSQATTRPRHVRSLSSSHQSLSREDVFKRPLLSEQQQQQQQQHSSSHGPVFSLPFKQQVAPEVLAPTTKPVPQPLTSLPFKHQSIPEVLTPAPSPTPMPAFVLPFFDELVPQTQTPTPMPTPNASYRPSYGLPNGFCTLAPELFTTLDQTTINTPSPRLSFNFMPVCPVSLPPIARPQLNVANVSTIDSKDSRQYRWDRVVGYVNQARRAHNPSAVWIASQRHETNTPIDRQSLWDGGSCGTDGVDEFIWDDDLDEKGRRFTIPPRDEPTMFIYEEGTVDLDVKYAQDHYNDERPAKRSRSAEREAREAAEGMKDYLNALRSFELDQLPELRREISGFA